MIWLNRLQSWKVTLKHPVVAQVAQESALVALATSRLDAATSEGGGEAVLGVAMNKLVTVARLSVNAAAYATATGPTVLDASHAVNRAVEAARDASGADGDGQGHATHGCLTGTSPLETLETVEERQTRRSPSERRGARSLARGQLPLEERLL